MIDANTHIRKLFELHAWMDPTLCLVHTWNPRPLTGTIHNSICNE